MNAVIHGPRSRPRPCCGPVPAAVLPSSGALLLAFVPQGAPHSGHLSLSSEAFECLMQSTQSAYKSSRKENPTVCRALNHTTPLHITSHVMISHNMRSHHITTPIAGMLHLHFLPAVQDPQHTRCCKPFKRVRRNR